MADIHEPKNTLIIIYGVVSCIVLFFIIVGLLYYFQRVQNWETHVKVELAPAVELRKLRDYESATLNQYEYVNKDQKIVRIPIGRAMELEAQGSWRLNARISGEAPLIRKGEGGTSHALP